MKKKTAIIFGITGQDGSHLADLLIGKGYNVIGVERRSSTNNTERIKHLLPYTTFDLVQGDITDAHSIAHILLKYANVDEIYNLAAQSHVAVSFNQPALTWDITGKGCLNILQCMYDLKIDAKFYQASSSEMFGKECDERLQPMMKDGKIVTNPEMGGKGVYESVKYQDENTKFMPQSPYAIAKCAAHHITRLFREAYGVHASSGILFNHEGPRRGENFVTRKITLWIGEFVQWKRQQEELETEDGFGYDYQIPSDMISVVRTNPNNEPYGHKDSWIFGCKFPKLRLGNLEAFRDWGYAGDYVEAMWMMLQQESPQDYVICTGETHTIREFLDAAFSQVGIEDWKDLVFEDPEFYRPAEVDYLRGDNSKASRELGWTPTHTFTDLVKMMVDNDLK